MTDGNSKARGRHDVFASARAVCRKVLNDHPTKKTFRLRIHREHLELFREWLESTDPDMPPASLCKLLGHPAVGDMMMNSKLQRLDALAVVLGTLTDQLDMIFNGAKK